MRYNTKVIFRKHHISYNVETGNYTDAPPTTHTEYASVDGTRESVMTLVYGGVVQDSLTIQLQNHVPFDFDDVLIDGKAYKVDYRNPKKCKDVYVLSRV